MNPIEFREITLENLDAVIALQVAPDQTELVADNLYSIAQAGLDPTGWCSAACVDGKPVGFFYVREQDSGTRIYLCRFMIDQSRQRRGLGRRIMAQLLDTLFSAPQVEMIDLAVSRTDGGAQSFYEKCGFTPTGEPYRGSWRMILPRSHYQSAATEVQGRLPDLQLDAQPEHTRIHRDMGANPQSPF